MPTVWTRTATANRSGGGRAGTGRDPGRPSGRDERNSTNVRWNERDIAHSLKFLMKPSHNPCHSSLREHARPGPRLSISGASLRRVRTSRGSRARHAVTARTRTHTRRTTRRVVPSLQGHQFHARSAARHSASLDLPLGLAADRAHHQSQLPATVASTSTSTRRTLVRVVALTFGSLLTRTKSSRKGQRAAFGRALRVWRTCSTVRLYSS